jgi:hypothetical protein
VSIPPVTAVTRCLQPGRAASPGATRARARSRLASACRLAGTRRLAGAGRLASTRLAGVQFRLAGAAGLAAAMAAPASGCGRLAAASGRRGLLGRPGPGAVGRLTALACTDACT